MVKQQYKDLAIKFLKGEWIKFALKRIMGSAVMGGIQGWFVKIAASYAFSKVLKPAVLWIFRKVNRVSNNIKGKKKAKKVEEARDANDKDDYDSAVDDIFK